ncbi:hypothetical protein MYA_5067 [Burkholderia sp. KJ006]|nr:hypothetical protein MYA_5067 [Burkholderia sp. KJ006]
MAIVWRGVPLRGGSRRAKNARRRDFPERRQLLFRDGG